MAVILIADDEKHIRELVRYNLEVAGFDVIEAADGVEAVKTAREHVPDLVLLDIMMPGMDGFEVCRALKESERTRTMPVIMLTAKSEELDKVEALELGADDYVVKPFGVRELVARVRAMLRRMGDRTDRTISAGGITVDLQTYSTTAGEQPVALTLKEFELLAYLMTHEAQVLSRETLLEKIWGYEYMGETRTVDVHIRHLRVKLGDYARVIDTVRGVGYRFKA